MRKIFSATIATSIVFVMLCSQVWVDYALCLSSGYDWKEVIERAQKAKELYQLYYDKALSSEWWHERAIDYAQAVADLWNPLALAADELFMSILPDAIGSVDILWSSYQLTTGTLKFYLAIFHDQVSGVIADANAKTSLKWTYLKSLIQGLDSVISAAEAHNEEALTAAFEQEKNAMKTLFLKTAEFDDVVFDDTLAMWKFGGSWAKEVYYLIRAHMVTLRAYIESNFLYVTDRLGERKFIWEDVNYWEASLKARYSPPVILWSHWTVNGEYRYTAEVGEEVTANLFLVPNIHAWGSPSQVKGQLTFEIRKDMRVLPDKTFCTRAVPVEIGPHEGRDVTFSFTPDEPSCDLPIPFTLEGYYIRAYFTGEELFFDTIEDTRVMWLAYRRMKDGWLAEIWEDQMTDCYPPRLHVDPASEATLC